MTTSADLHHALVLAIELGDAEAVERAIAEGADVNQPDRRPLVGNNNTSLHDAANLGHLEIVQLLLKNGADKNAQCNAGWTPLLRACNAGHIEVVRCLLKAGADPTLANHEGYTPLSRSRGDPEIEALLNSALRTGP